MASGTPAENRKQLLARDWGYYRDLFNDLQRAHPDIRQCVASIDVMRMGHAMVCPVPGWPLSMHQKTRRMGNAIPSLPIPT